jgi:hypothetical protein
VLADELAEAGAASDTELVAAAKTLMVLVDEAGALTGKYNVTHAAEEMTCTASVVDQPDHSRCRRLGDRR